MKIAVNARLLVSQKMDGIGRFTFETIQRISKKHAEHDFVLIFDRKVDEGFSFASNVSTVVLPPPARHPILWYIWFEVRLKRFVNTGNFDLFISPEGWVPPDLKCKSLAVMHDLNFEHHPENIIASHRKYLLHYFPKFAKRADRIATVSEYSKQDIIHCYGVPENSIDVVFNGASALFRPIDSKAQKHFREKHTQGSKFFLFVGTLHPRKNLEHLFLGFEAFKNAQDSDVQLLVVGNKKWWPDDLEAIYSKMKWKDSIIFSGRLNDQQLAQAVGSALALTYLPYFEGFGIPILEAFKSGTPVITSNVTSMPEVAGGAALLCDPRKQDEIATRMREIFESEELRQQLIEKGNARAAFFSWEKTANLLWESILKTK